MDLWRAHTDRDLKSGYSRDDIPRTFSICQDLVLWSVFVTQDKKWIFIGFVVIAVLISGNANSF